MTVSYPNQLRLASLQLAAGTSPARVGLDASWRIVDEVQLLGCGPDCFATASDNLLAFRVHHRAGVRVRRVRTDAEVVWLRVGPTVSPCRILRISREPARTVLVYGTMQGHVECGEEAFIIEHRADDTVVGRCVAFSQPARWFARRAPRLAAAAQAFITRRYLAGMVPS